MSNIGLYLNHAQVVDVCTKLKCHDGELSKIIKASILGEKTSRYFRDFFAKSETKIEEIDEQSIIDNYLMNTELGIINLRRADLLSKPVFTPT